MLSRATSTQHLPMISLQELDVTTHTYQSNSLLMQLLFAMLVVGSRSTFTRVFNIKIAHSLQCNAVVAPGSFQPLSMLF